MRRILAITAVLVAAAALAFVATGAGGGGDGGTYLVRAIFDNAGFVIPGEDVKVAGVRVGSIDSLDVTKDNKAAVVLNITEPGFQDFRQDASCRVRPQSLIGERFVDCSLTQPHPPGQKPPPPLHKITKGPGTGQYLLPVDRNSTPVDLDLIADINRQPVRERLSIILDELGTGVAGRGKDLNEVIRRADPALQETDNLLQLLASQNHTLEELARNSDTVLAPLAAKRRQVADAIANSSKVAAATASRRGDLEADIQRLPAFLTQLRPTMRRLGALSDEMTPVLEDLDSVAPSVNRLIMQLGPFSQAGIPAVTSLGQAAKVGTPAVIKARPVIRDLRRLAVVTRPVARTAAKVLESFQKTRGIERLMDYTFYQTTAVNGFDAIGHYLRAGLIVNQCSNYSIRPTGGCSANFTQASSTSASAAGAAPRDKVLMRTAAALAKALGNEMRKVKAKAKTHGAKDRRTASRHNGGRTGGNGGATATAPSATATPGASPAPGGTPSAPAPAASATAAPSGGGGQAPPPSRTDALLDYLFGSDR